MTLVLTSSWQDPPAQPGLDDWTAHLWRFPLDGPQSLQTLLDGQELQRAGRLRIPAKARAFITARARLRQILSAYLGVAPQALRFAYGPAGKPVLAWPLSTPLSFNLAHSGQWGLCAVTGGIEVGVDIEQVDRRLDYARLAAHFFSANERACLQAASLLRRRRLFFRIWTRKEAWLKGKGSGFSTVEHDIGAMHLGGCCTHDGNWWLRTLPVARHYLATLALPQAVSRLQRWNGGTLPD